MMPLNGQHGTKILIQNNAVNGQKGRQKIVSKVANASALFCNVILYPITEIFCHGLFLVKYS